MYHCPNPVDLLARSIALWARSNSAAALRSVVPSGVNATESSGAGTSLRADASYERPDSIGNVSPTVELEVRDPATGAALGEGEVGEICIRTAALFLGYWENPDATTAALDADRWYRTGDFGHVRDEFVYLEGRRQDLIIRGGENIGCGQVEAALLAHPHVIEAAVYSVPDERLGEEVGATLYASPELDVDELRASVTHYERLVRSLLAS